MKELVDPRRTGLHFNIGNSEDLVTKVEWLLEHPQQLEKMRYEARVEFENRFSAQTNYQQLIDIYQQAITCNQPKYLNNNNKI